MFRFVKRIFVLKMFFCCNLSNINPLECVSVNNQERKVTPEIVNIDSNEPVFYCCSIKQVNAVLVVTISIVPMQNCVFLMLLRA